MVRKIAAILAVGLSMMALISPALASEFGNVIGGSVETRSSEASAAALRAVIGILQGIEERELKTDGDGGATKLREAQAALGVAATSMSDLLNSSDFQEVPINSDQQKFLAERASFDPQLLAARSSKDIYAAFQVATAALSQSLGPAIELAGDKTRPVFPLISRDLANYIYLAGIVTEVLRMNQ